MGASSRPVLLQFKGDDVTLRKSAENKMFSFFGSPLTPPTSVPMYECMCNSCSQGAAAAAEQHETKQHVQWS